MVTAFFGEPGKAVATPAGCRGMLLTPPCVNRGGHHAMVQRMFTTLRSRIARRDMTKRARAEFIVNDVH